MTNFDLLNIDDAHSKLVSHEITVSELVDFFVKRAREENERLNSFVEIFNDEDIKKQIDVAQTKIDNGDATYLTGIPCAIKDNMVFLGHISSCGSKILENYIGSYDSTIVSILKDEASVIIGRTNMDEFAMGSSTETSYFGNTKNPYDETRVPGGSSGGAVASLSSKSVLFSLGSDTGGSIRQPASLCNLVGLKPTYGTVSRYGLIALASSLDQIGPFTHSVSESENIFNIISKYDKKDSTSVPIETRESYRKQLKKKIGVPKHFFENGGVDPEILEKFNFVLKELELSGYEIVPIKLNYIHYSLPVYYIIQPAEASSNLARFDGIRYGISEESNNLIDVYKKTRGIGFGKEVRRRILIGTYVLSHGYYDAYYGKALAMKEIIKKEVEDVLNEVDAIATPTTTGVAFKFGEKVNDPVSMYLEDIFTVPANITGNPSISVPIGFNKDGLPFGMQLIGPLFNEHILFSIGKDIENELK
jgi:aspartyl-tRNA(Asn)/glutamyl-tRNA(Gln) amidotransferase subunit A